MLAQLRERGLQQGRRAGARRPSLASSTQRACQYIYLHMLWRVPPFVPTFVSKMVCVWYHIHILAFARLPPSSVGSVSKELGLKRSFI